MRDPDQSFRVDSVKLRRFVSKVEREAKRSFGDSLDVIVVDRSRFESVAATLPVRRHDLVETDAEWRDVLRMAIGNAHSAMDSLDRLYRHFEHVQQYKENFSGFAVELAKYAKRRGVEIVIASDSPWPKLPGDLKWKGLSFANLTKAPPPEIGNLWPNDRKAMFEHLDKAIPLLEEQAGAKLAKFMVRPSHGNMYVMGAIPKEAGDGDKT